MGGCLSKEETLLFEEGNFEYHTCTAKYRDDVLHVLARAFMSEPVVSARGRKNKKHRVTYHDWVKFVDYWMDHCSTNGMSCIAIDKKLNKVAGAFIVRDLLMKPEGFEKTYSDKKNNLTPWMQFLWHMDKEATKVKKELGEPGKAVDLWFLGVSPEYRGNRIASYLTKGVLDLCRKTTF